MSLSITSRAIDPIGFGMGGLTQPRNGEVMPTASAIAVLKAALEAGANFWNASEIAGTPTYNGLHLLHAYFNTYPADAERVVISVKSCFDLHARQASNDAAGVRECVERCLAVLDGKCRIDIFQPCRLDPDVPVEETVAAVAKFVRAGKLGGVGLSECSAASIRKAVTVCPIAAVEVEVSLFETGIFTNGIAEACKEFGIPIVAYSPLSRGFLTGQLRKFTDLPQADFRHMFPRFQKEVFDENVKLADAMQTIAARKGCSATQVALAWLCARSSATGVPIIPIPGASSEGRVRENTKAVQLSEEELQEIDEILTTLEIKGGRVPPQFARWLEV